MKKIQLKGKLSLNKETIAKLNDEQMGMIKGGDGENEIGGTRLLCFASKADNCTASSCARSTTVIVCINL